MSGPSSSQVEEQLQFQVIRRELVRASCYYSQAERANRIASLEGALSALRLHDIANGVTDFGVPDPALRWQVDPGARAVTLVKAGLAKRINGQDNVASGAA